MSEVNEEEESLAPCSIGKDAAASKCHVIFYAKKTGFKAFSDFTECDQKLLVSRSEAKLDENSIICFHHEALFLHEYQAMQKKCCNPFKKRNHNVKAGLRLLDNETAAKLCLLKKKEVIDIKPGQKLCPRCMSALNQKLEDSSSLSTQSEQDFTTDETEPAINKSLSFIGASPLKRRQLSKRDKPSYAKRKILDAQSLIGNQIAAAVGINYDEQPSSSKSRPCSNCADLDNLIEELKEKSKRKLKKKKLLKKKDSCKGTL
ncbi:ARL14 effector protein-like [Schistocerca nitens]|uniref:ARL14 effector protein-like n=1 Tax=Schistocerca nitens TaxID=7011 RepID=UPI002119706E|nr:ARL14 effector protein-like [Schistocerca nitens]XP_049794982.1 ARL14 effector protein-like [Schistocerca nitens]XP_049797571.1 ARL14 effector protein-like [Schistocerca nitens]XP_049801541.1 ARL14 effector protein-like [Schistocerca nitens]